MPRVVFGILVLSLCAALSNHNSVDAQIVRATGVENRGAAVRCIFRGASCTENLRVQRLDTRIRKSSERCQCCMEQMVPCIENHVVKPCLEVTIDGARTGKAGDTLTFDLKTLNQCKIPLRNLSANVTLEGNGLEIVGRSNPVTFGPMKTPLAFGEAKTLSLSIKLLEEGLHCFRATIQVEGGHTVSIRVVIKVRIGTLG